jgi:hypothetical protein
VPPPHGHRRYGKKNSGKVQDKRTKNMTFDPNRPEEPAVGVSRSSCTCSAEDMHVRMRRIRRRVARDRGRCDPSSTDRCHTLRRVDAA